MTRKRIITFSFIPPHMDDEETHYGGFLIYSAFCDILHNLGYKVHRRTTFRTFQRLPEDYVYQMEQTVIRTLLCVPACRDIIVLNKRDYHEIATTPYHYTVLVTDAKDAKRYTTEHHYSV